MRIFVASRFFPPSTSSEGIVTYKLLRNSRFQYDVVSAKSSKWGYNSEFESHADNIHVIPVETDELAEWRDTCLRIFEERHAEEPYDAIMTRSMPSESVEVGLEIKKRHPSLPWICSLADPIGNNPYSRYAIRINQEFTEREKKIVLKELAQPREKWSINWLIHPSNTIRDQFYWKDIQDQALKNADLLISPVMEQLQYIDSDNIAGSKFVVFPHTFDEEFYTQTSCEMDWERGRTHLTFTGYSDTLRSLNPFLEAVKWIADRYPELLQKIKIHFIGNYPREIVDRALAWQIDDAFDFSGNLSYLKTLAVMQKSDWLLHVDAWFGELYNTGGSIFFAGKLADYMGAGKPILALTGNNSPAASIVMQSGGIVIPPQETAQIAGALMNIARGENNVLTSESFRAHFRADTVAAEFDAMLEDRVGRTAPTAELVYGKPYPEDKLLTVCVPANNAQKTLRRALDSLLAAETRNALEIIVVDDGSTDQTVEIGREYVERYPENVMLISKPSSGRGACIIHGIKQATGLYFRVVESDGWVNPKALEDELHSIRDAKESPDLFYTPCCAIDQVTGLSTYETVSEKFRANQVYSFADLIRKTGADQVCFTTATTSFRTALLRKTDLGLSEDSLYSDSELPLKQSSEVNTVVFLPYCVCRYLSIGHVSERFRINRKASAESRKPVQKFKRTIKSVLYSPVCMNRYTMGFLREQKEKHGIVFQLLQKLKD